MTWYLTSAVESRRLESAHLSPLSSTRFGSVSYDRTRPYWRKNFFAPDGIRGDYFLKSVVFPDSEASSPLDAIENFSPTHFFTLGPQRFCVCGIDCIGTHTAAWRFLVVDLGDLAILAVVAPDRVRRRDGIQPHTVVATSLRTVLKRICSCWPAARHPACISPIN